MFDLGQAEFQSSGWKMYGVAADDRRFLFAQRTRGRDPKSSIVLVENWYSEFVGRK